MLIEIERDSVKRVLQAVVTRYAIVLTDSRAVLILIDARHRIAARNALRCCFCAATAWRHWMPATFHYAHRDQTRQRQAVCPNPPSRVTQLSSTTDELFSARLSRGTRLPASIKNCASINNTLASVNQHRHHQPHRDILILIVARLSSRLSRHSENPVL
jgi:hypothetical protein